MTAMLERRAKVTVRGAVQGVGFRPFVYRLASELNLAGWVLNSGQGVFIEVEGDGEELSTFLMRLEKERPPRSIIHSLESSFVDRVGYKGFTIRFSECKEQKSVLISPDLATCDDCRREMNDPADRRYRYPFINCTNCGPRFSIIEALPYDRANTSMRCFAMCAECEREYHDPGNRRFHAQPNACPMCGPQIQLWDADGRVVAKKSEALRVAVQAVREGDCVALKGLGGFQLIVAAGREVAVERLRKRKHRDAKPLALMFPSLESVRRCCEVSEIEKQLLLSSEAPIVLLRRGRAVSDICAAVAPRNPYLGVMLPSTPLHHLLLCELGFPVVATSGNLSDEPICIDEQEALARLHGIADIFLVHDRPIIRHVDDSVVRVMAGRPLILRRARGYAPLPVHLQKPLPTILALGAHLKNTVALSVGREVFISQHIGDLETQPAHAAFRQVAADLPRLYEARPERIACDLHPDYLSTRYAVDECVAGETQRLDHIQHHWAHIVGCLAENHLEPPALGVAWDGTGLGLDGTIWGGEFLLARGSGFTRFAHLRSFPLPGGDAAIRQPSRSALGVLFEIFGDELWARDDLLSFFPIGERAVWRQMLEKKINTPVTSSAGRLFDAVAGLMGWRGCLSFEGQAAMELEFALEPCARSYPFAVGDSVPHVIDWQPAIFELMEDLRAQTSAGVMAAKFHNMLAQIIVAMARLAGEPRVALSGGCFQNKYLTEKTIADLQADGFRPCWPRQIPPNDGGIAFGQIIAAMMAAQEREMPAPAAMTNLAAAKT